MQNIIRAKSAWASLLKPDFTPDATSTLTEAQICSDYGEKTFKINPDAVEDTKRKWSTAIIGQVMGNSSSFLNMKKFAEERWASKGLLEVQKKEDDLFVFRFQSDDAKQDILDHSPLPFGNRVLFLWPWSRNKPIQRMSLDRVPVWIKLPDLNLHYYNTHVLSGLGTLIGKLLFMDKLTATQGRVSFAIICVELKAGDPLPENISFIDEEGIHHKQEVTYEWIPTQCPKSETFGHNCQATSPQAKPVNIKENHSKASAFPAKIKIQTVNKAAKEPIKSQPQTLKVTVPPETDTGPWLKDKVLTNPKLKTVPKYLSNSS